MILRRAPAFVLRYLDFADHDLTELIWSWCVEGWSRGLGILILPHRCAISFAVFICSDMFICVRRTLFHIGANESTKRVLGLGSSASYFVLLLLAHKGEVITRVIAGDGPGCDSRRR